MRTNLEAVSYINSVEAEAQWLLQRLGTPGADLDQAVDSVESYARQGLRDLTGGPDRFGPTAETADLRMPDLDAVSQAAARLEVAGTLFAADQATEPGAGPDARQRLAGAVERLTEIGRMLETLDTRSLVGFAPKVIASSSAAAARDRLQIEADATLDAVVARAGALVRLVSGQLTGQSPQAIRNAVNAVGTRVNLGERLGKLGSLALRLVERVLEDLSSSFLPDRLLRGTREKIRDLMEASATGDLTAIVAAVLGVPAVRRTIQASLAQSGLDRARLDRGVRGLLQLRGRYGHVMDWTEGVVIAFAASGPLLIWLYAIPHLALIVPLVFMAALGAGVVISADYVDSGLGLGVIHGVRHVVTSACGVMS